MKIFDFEYLNLKFFKNLKKLKKNRKKLTKLKNKLFYKKIAIKIIHVIIA